MKAAIYFTEIPDQYKNKNMEHMIGEKVLEEGLEREYSLKLGQESRAIGEHGKPFLSRQPSVHYNISHSGDYVVCVMSGEEVGIDIQKHKEVNYSRLLERMVPAYMIREILEADNIQRAFFTQWVLREAYIKWTGEGLSRDLRTIPMNEGSYLLLDLGEGYSGAVWSQDLLELEWKNVEVKLP